MSDCIYAVTDDSILRKVWLLPPWSTDGVLLPRSRTSRDGCLSSVRGVFYTPGRGQCYG